MFIAIFFKTVLGGLACLFLAGLFLILCGFVGQCFFGQSVILEESQQWLHHEKMIVSKIVRGPRIVPSIDIFFTQHALNLWQSFVEPNDLAKWHPLKTCQKTDNLKNLLQKYYQRLQVSQQIFCNLLEVAMLRLWVVILFLPLFSLLGFIGLIDGLVQRHLRKLHGARESSVLYQRLKACLAPSLWSAGVLYVGLPLCVNPIPLFLLFALLFSVMLAMAARTYKKYI